MLLLVVASSVVARRFEVGVVLLLWPLLMLWWRRRRHLLEMIGTVTDVDDARDLGFLLGFLGREVELVGVRLVGQHLVELRRLARHALGREQCGVRVLLAAALLVRVRLVLLHGHVAFGFGALGGLDPVAALQEVLVVFGKVAIRLSCFWMKRRCWRVRRMSISTRFALR